MSGSRDSEMPDGQVFEVQTLQSNLVTRERIQVRRQVSHMLRAARQQAALVLVQARRQARLIHRKARTQGYLEARRQVARRIGKALVRLERSTETTLAGLLPLATAMARRIIRHELETNPATLAQICRQVIDEHRLEGTVRLVLNPGDLARVHGAWDEGLSGPGRVKVMFVTSPEIEPGGCLLEGDWGRIDGRLDVQLEELSDLCREAISD